MLKTHERAEIKDLNGKGTGITMEVNWAPDDEKSNESKLIRLKVDDKKYVVRKEEFLSFLWLIGNEDEHRKMIPQKLTKVRWYETVLSVKANKDIRKGEQITFPIKISLPAIEEEVIGEIKKHKQSGIQLPKNQGAVL